MCKIFIKAIYQSNLVSEKERRQFSETFKGPFKDLSQRLSFERLFNSQTSIERDIFREFSFSVAVRKSDFLDARSDTKCHTDHKTVQQTGTIPIFHARKMTCKRDKITPVTRERTPTKTVEPI